MRFTLWLPLLNATGSPDELNKANENGQSPSIALRGTGKQHHKNGGQPLFSADYGNNKRGFRKQKKLARTKL